MNKNREMLCRMSPAEVDEWARVMSRSWMAINSRGQERWATPPVRYQYIIQQVLAGAVIELRNMGTSMSDDDYRRAVQTVADTAELITIRLLSDCGHRVNTYYTVYRPIKTWQM